MTVVMISNSTGFAAGQLFGEFPGQLAHLFSPGGQRGPWRFGGYSYALDNGAWSAWKNNRDFDVPAWRSLCGWAEASGVEPRWALVPDAVADRDRTIERWAEFSPVVRAHGFRAAFAVQDGMTFEDVPDSECILFLGGSTVWKLAAIEPWCARFPGRVHVARVNDIGRLRRCHLAGAVSVDGTGWFHSKSSSRDGISQADELRGFLQETA